MKHRPIPAEYAKVADWLLPQMLPWRRLTIAIDGVDGAGKSSLARFLAWQLAMPAIETDFFLREGEATPVHDTSALKSLVEQTHLADRPVIVEGLFVLRQLVAIGVDPEILLRVQCHGHDGSFTWQHEFANYLAQYPRASAPDYTLVWNSGE